MDELVLNPGEPTLVEPSLTTVLYNPLTVIPQNPMDTVCRALNTPETLGILYVSTHGDIYKKWLEVEAGNYVKFNTPTYFLQKTSVKVTFPVYEIAEVP